jgi:hypothetical protein
VTAEEEEESMRSTCVLFSLMVVFAAWLGACSIQGPEPEPGDEGARPPADDGRPDDATAEPIIGGSEATAYPLAVLVNMKRNGWQVSSCSGSVIAPRVVLTAGHCVVTYDGWDIVAPYAGGQTASSSQAVTYDWTDNGDSVNPNQHDVGLVFLDSDIVLTHYPLIATQKLASGTKILNIGRKDNGTLSSSKLFVSQPVSIYDGSTHGFAYDYASNEIIEPGDSGGPDVLPGPAPRTIVAVNSGAGNGWQILARVDLLHSWIADQVANHGGTPQPPPPETDPPSCSHDSCLEGDKLVSSCDPCVQQICAQDPYCCSTQWDGQCVSEVDSVCGNTCGPPPPAPPDPCNGVTFEGECNGCVLSWCDGSQLHTVDCGASSKQCGWDGNGNFYNCL